MRRRAPSSRQPGLRPPRLLTVVGARPPPRGLRGLGLGTGAGVGLRSVLAENCGFVPSVCEVLAMPVDGLGPRCADRDVVQDSDAVPASPRRRAAIMVALVFGAGPAASSRPGPAWLSAARPPALSKPSRGAPAGQGR